MLRNIFDTLVLISGMVSVFAVILALSEKITKKYFSSSWHYVMWVIITICLVIPIKFKVYIQPAVYRLAISEVTVPDWGGEAAASATDIPQTVDIISVIWLTVAVGLFSIKLIKFYRYLYKIKKTRRGISCPQVKKYTKRQIPVYCSNAVISPFISGIFAPELILPDRPYDDGTLSDILLHEITHLKRFDVPVKWVVTAIKCIHWFNPFVYLIGQKVNDFCEISCDIAATAAMTAEEKTKYVDTILRLMTKSIGRNDFSLAMARGKKQLFKRFVRIKDEKPMTGIKKTVAVMLGIIISGGVALSIGSILGKLNPIVLSPLPPLPETDNIFPSTYKVKVKEPPSIPADSPAAVADSEAVTVHRDESPVNVPEPSPMPTPSPVQKPEYPSYMGSIAYDETTERIGADEILRQEGNKPYCAGATVNLAKEYTAFNYNFDNATTMKAKVYPDKHGNICIYFDSDFSNVNAKINISEETMKGLGWGYSVLTDNRRAYYFCNFDPSKVYDVVVSSHCPGNYNIEGQLLIY